MLEGKKILLGVSGGIAVYKAVALTSKLTQAGAEVRVIMTESATEFVTPLTFQAISRNPVYTDTFDEKDAAKIAHIDLADWADLVVIAPATANIIGKLANGIVDNMLTTTLIATEVPVYIAPAMNVHMYQHPAVINNLHTLEKWGYKFIEPGDGYLACGYVGKGRLEEPENIVEILEVETSKTTRWKGKKVLITAGPTRETVDPVRYFTNYSSGKMGYALAQAAMENGAEVILVSGPTTIKPPVNVTLINVTTAAEMFEQVKKYYKEMDVIIKSAAVADYRPIMTYEHKMKKQKGPLSIEMERTTDILQYVGEHKTTQYVVGFAAETQEIEEYGRQKMNKKNLDAIVVNDIGKEGIGFRSDINEVKFMTKDGEEQAIEQATKKNIAKQIIQLIDVELRKDA
ncbi:bifunctional phosphopantothenoylcysteine decarboxylase/phosphopantothenate--cysteine ligase CoaBC [Gracilibacillus sp. S3-1-1]|uniref:Bifunctional phosphopantothenoylcysteine decarboxylase/phosphopantothenate--cysteine ligase CoaBC n=1 Tax=Gracilibacillus pellucidus TaxID=3095368 RepID=A0ACC6M264_9BACI|nr:bifunctional phosphopantothenoylcysteine decarboxylase/phosphopantothenate--cysteine ligase CoaBC [Gracilibacillus sp. S3-1-1]MDX8045003.1 bifunctional phosphopantothenoylcysteine decarboxylase/phosphopantothenate--cysteine ligase CoaBC [Gracilibacillus sp. S3-1-1]